MTKPADQSAQPKSVAIVGGGISGLICAHKLATSVEPGTLNIHVFEASDSFGGKIRTSSFAGKLVDEAADSFLTRGEAMLDVVESLGLNDQLIAPASLPPLLLDGNQLHPMPKSLLGVPTSIRDLFKSSAVSTKGALRALGDYLPNVFYRGVQPTKSKDISVAKAVQRLGPEVRDKMIAPLIGSINGGFIESLSVNSTAPQIAGLRSRHFSLIRGARQALKARKSSGPVFLAPSSGMATITNTLVSRLIALGVTLHAKTSVEAVVKSSNGWLLSRSSVSERHNPSTHNSSAHNSSAQSQTFDAVILATPAFVSASILEDLDRDVARRLASISFASVAMIRLAYKRRHIAHQLNASGYLSIPQDGRLITAASFASSKWERLGEDDTVIFRLSSGRIGDNRAMAMSDANLIAEATKDLAQHVGAASAPVAADVIRWPKSFPQYEVGHGQLMADIENDLGKYPGIHLIGASTYGIGVASCAATALRGASQVLKHLGLQPALHSNRDRSPGKEMSPRRQAGASQGD